MNSDLTIEPPGLLGVKLFQISPVKLEYTLLSP